MLLKFKYFEFQIFLFIMSVFWQSSENFIINFTQWIESIRILTIWDSILIKQVHIISLSMITGQPRVALSKRIIIK
jgi:hypothetical protein